MLASVLASLKGRPVLLFPPRIEATDIGADTVGGEAHLQTFKLANTEASMCSTSPSTPPPSTPTGGHGCMLDSPDTSADDDMPAWLREAERLLLGEVPSSPSPALAATAAPASTAAATDP